MATLMRGQKEGLEYLESVRQHMSRLPNIDPNQPSILISGFPNVGKSSFMNRITRADVEVQPYAFTTKSLYVGHTDHNYLKWQVIDTPGILDKPLEQRNTIEMQAITALAHIKAIVLYFLDVSETCGYSLQDQVALYANIQPLFINKPIMIIANKVDIKGLDELSEENRLLLDKTFYSQDVPFKTMSALTHQGVIDVKNEACDRLLAFRVEHKSKSKKMELIANRLRMAIPIKTDIGAKRLPFIPPGAMERLISKLDSKAKAKTLREESLSKYHDGVRYDEQRMNIDEEIPITKKTERDIEMEMGDDYVLDLKKHYDLANIDHVYDILPEILNGKNVADFVDMDIFKKLEELEREEEIKIETGFYETTLSDSDQNPPEIKTLAKKIRLKKQLRIIETRLKKSSNKPRLPRNIKGKSGDRTPKNLMKHMNELGAHHLRTHDFKNLKKNAIVKRYASNASLNSCDGSINIQNKSLIKRARVDPITGLVKSSTTTPRNLMGIQNMQMKTKLDRMAQKSLSPFIMDGRVGESDRHVYDLKPKHLFCGKRKMGKTNKR
ncbi:unnamed protein product [Gordionus sp. m RMFG-2023]